MNFESVDFHEKERWNSIVKSYSDWDVYYLNEYSKGLTLLDDETPILINFENDHCKIALVTMKRDISKLTIFNGIIPKETFFDTSTPYGYGGPLVDGNPTKEDIKIFMEEYRKISIKNGIVSEFIRFNPLNNNSILFSHYYEVEMIRNTITIDISEDESTIWNNIPSKNKNMIRKAIKNGVTVEEEINEKTVTAFKNIYSETMKRDNALKYYFFNDNFFNSMFNDLKSNCTIFCAKYKEKIIASTVVLYSEKFEHYHLSSIKNEYMSLGVNNLLLYEICKWGHNKKILRFHLGGGYESPNDSLYKFKRSFTKVEPLNFYIGRAIYDREKYNFLVEKRQHLDEAFNSKNEYFPRYRWQK